MLEIRAFEQNDLLSFWELSNLFRRNPILLDQQLELEQQPQRENTTRERFTAVLKGHIIGFSSLTKQLYMNKDCFFAQIAVKPETRSIGVGSQLLGHLKELAFEWNATKLHCEVNNLEPRDLRFLERCGIKIKTQSVLSKLDFLDFDVAKFQLLEQNNVTEHFRFVRLSEFPDTPDTRANLYQLVRQSVEDDAGFEGEFESLEQFNEYIWKIYWDAREHWVLAIDGSKFVAMAGATPVTTEIWHAHLTGVARSHRGRGLAQIVKSKSTQIARDSGAKSIETSNDAKNTAMIAVNRKIGFVHVGDRYWLELPL